MNDPDILSLYRERREDAIRCTEQKYGRLLLSLARNILGGEEDAAECVSDTLLAAWNAIPPANPQSLCAYLCAITRNLARKRLSYLTAEKRDRSLTDPLGELSEAIEAPAVGLLSEKELARLISDFLRTRPVTERQIFLRRYFFQDGIGAIAAMMGYSESKVKSTLFRTRTRLRRYLQEEGIDL